MTSPKKELTMIGNFYQDGIPRVVEVEDIDTWPEKKATEQFMKNVANLINLGFKGVRLEHYKVSNTHMSDGTAINLIYLPETPEGQIVTCMEFLAYTGEFVDFDMVLSSLEEMYEKRNLKLPYDKR